MAPIVVLVIWNFVTNLTFTLDAPIIAGAQIIYMIRVGIQIAHLTDQLKENCSSNCLSKCHAHFWSVSNGLSCTIH